MSDRSAAGRGERPSGRADARSAVDLLWIPLGAGASVPTVRWCGRGYEALAAAREHRPRLDLFHAALELRDDDAQYVVEMTPAWGPAHQPGSVATGPVGLRSLGRSRLFRYEVHCSRDGVIPDREFAVDVRRVAHDHDVSRRVRELAPTVPTATWGRDELRAGEMWNSNSIVAWLLSRAGASTADLHPPEGGRAPGWSAGLTVAARP